MKTVLLVVLILVLTAPGCRSRRFINVGSSGGNEVGVSVESIDRYAEEHGISWEEALRQIRQEQRSLAEEARVHGDLADAVAQTTQQTEIDALEKVEGKDRLDFLETPDGTLDAEPSHR